MSIKSTNYFLSTISKWRRKKTAQMIIILCIGKAAAVLLSIREKLMNLNSRFVSRHEKDPNQKL
jgi:hypothetical protein